MLASFRRLSNSKIGTGVVAIFFILILVGFAASDISNFGSGNIGFGMSSSTLARVGDQSITDKDMADAMERHLQEVRQQKPSADYSTIIGDFDAMLEELINGKTLMAFADKFDFPLSKRLVDAEIAQIPQTKGLNGEFSEQAYRGFLAQQRLTDEQVRDILTGGLLQRLLLTPVAGNARISTGMAAPYAAMLLESREGQAAAFPVSAFRAGLKPTESQVQQYYSANRNRYMVPEQRVIRIAKIGPERVADVSATDQEVTAYYNAHKADYAPKDTRDLSQALVPDQATANQIAARAKAGAALKAASAPAGSNAAVTTLTGETQDAYAGVAGKEAAAAVFAGKTGDVVGPLKTNFGWLVVKIESSATKGGKSVDQARTEIAAQLNTSKRKQAIEDLVDKVQDAIDGGNNFAEAATAAKLTVITTPLLTASGASRAQPDYKLPPELAPALKSAFEIEPTDPPEIVTLPNDQGYAMVSPAQTVSAAPAPLASVHDQVANDWIDAEASKRARAAASAIEAKVSSGAALDQAIKQAGVSGAEVRPISARRIQIAQSQNPVPEPLKVLFSLGDGKSKMFADPQGRGYFIVKVTKIVPGNATLEPQLIGQVETELQSGVSDDYAREFLSAIRSDLKAKRNESAIQAEKTRMAGSSS